jgi:hypothetical protein
MKNGKKDDVSIRSFLLNKRERYEFHLKQTGKDLRLEEIDGLIEAIKLSRQNMYERKKRIEGFDFVYGEGKIVELLNEVFDNYTLGKYYSTIAVGSMAAERLCYDFIEFLDIKIGNRVLTEVEKEELTYIPYNKLVTFLLKLGVLDRNSKSLLNKINDIRNKHLHPKMKGAEKDALDVVNLLCKVLESRLSMFRFYELVDGKFVRKLP